MGRLELHFDSNGLTLHFWSLAAALGPPTVLVLCHFFLFSLPPQLNVAQHSSWPGGWTSASCFEFPCCPPRSRITHLHRMNYAVIAVVAAAAAAVVELL